MDPYGESRHDKAAGDVADFAVPEITTVAQMTLEGLRPTTTVLSFLCLFFALAHSQLPRPLSGMLVPGALCCAALLLWLRWQLRRSHQIRLPLQVYSVAVAAIILSHSFADLALTRDPSAAFGLMLLLAGGSFIFLSLPLLIGLAVVTMVGWGVLFGPEILIPPWRFYGISLLSSAALGFILQTTRLHSYRRLEALRSEADERARALSRRALHLETLITVGHSINGFLDVGALLDYVTETVHTTFGYDYVGVFLADETGRYLDSRAAAGTAGKQLLAERCRLELGKQGLVGWASRYREPVCVNDVTHDDRYLEIDALAGTRSEMVLPLEMGDTLLGILDLQSDRVNAFSEEDFRVCRSLAGQISTALQNASMYELEHARRSLMETLYQVGRALSQTLDVGEVLDLILSSLATVVAFDSGAVALAGDDGLEIVAARGFPEDGNPLTRWLPIGEGGAFQTICETKQPLAIPDVAELPMWEFGGDFPSTRAWVGLPLINAEDVVIGVLSLSRNLPEAYTADEVAFCTAFAGQAGIALNNAQLYMELSEAYRQLRRLDSAKSDFITLASHELRTPLTLVTGYSRMLMDEPTLTRDPALYKMASGAELGAARLQEIVDRMMDLAEIESQSLQLELEPIALGRLLSDVVADISGASSQRQIEIVLDDLSGMPTIEADHVSLGKVFRQLIMNAIKYTPDGGQVLISGEYRHPVRESIEGRCVEITVADTGIGIDPEHHGRIFDRFCHIGQVGLHSSGTVKFQGGGPGLGLAMVKGIVTAHRGDVWVESAGRDIDACPGSCFHVLLPIEQPVVGREMQQRLLQIEAIGLQRSQTGGPVSSDN